MIKDETISAPPLTMISFSGGRTSGYMTKRLLDENPAGQHVVVFANTGQEDPRTLDFVHRCDVEFGFNTIWVEAVVNPTAREGTKHKIVTYESASRDGKPFEEVIKKYGIPNKPFPHCTRELKLRPISAYMKSICEKNDDYRTAIGIRADEKRRVSRSAEARNIFYPLVDWNVDKQEVLDWWKEQKFDLEIEEHQGNCVWCWKKSLTKHMRLIRESPQVFDFPSKMESLYGLTGAGTIPGKPRHFFREDRSTSDLLNLYRTLGVTAQFPPSREEENSGCSESCELYPTENEP